MTSRTIAENIRSSKDVGTKGDSRGMTKDVGAKGDSRRIRSVSGETFEALVLHGQGPIAVEFMSYGCAHCRAIEPFLQEVAEAVSAKEQVFRVNVAVEQALASSYQIGGTPTLVMFLDAREVGRVEGPPPTRSGVMSAVTGAFK